MASGRFSKVRDMGRGRERKTCRCAEETCIECVGCTLDPLWERPDEELKKKWKNLLLRDGSGDLDEITGTQERKLRNGQVS